MVWGGEFALWLFGVLGRSGYACWVATCALHSGSVQESLELASD